MSMPTGKQPEAGPFARAIAAEIRESMARQRVSGQMLADWTGMSQSYLSRRLADKVAFTANDIEAICKVLGEDILTLIEAAVESAGLSPKPPLEDEPGAQE